MNKDEAAKLLRRPGLLRSHAATVAKTRGVFVRAIYRAAKMAHTSCASSTVASPSDETIGHFFVRNQAVVLTGVSCDTG